MMKSLPKWFFATGALSGLCGMLWGIQMSMSHDHTLAAAHGHLNLLGFVVMSVFGTYYALTPKAVRSALAPLHLVVSIMAVLLLPPGIALAILERTAILAQAGSVMAVMGMLFFVVAVLRYGVGCGEKSPTSYCELYSKPAI